MTSQPYYVTFLDKHDNPMSTKVIDAYCYLTACDAMFGEMPEGCEEFDIKDKDGNIPAV